MIDGVINRLRKARHRHFVGLVRPGLREPDIHLRNQRSEDQTFPRLTSKRAIYESIQTNLELLHQLADGFAAGPDNAGVGPRVQVNVLAHHLLQLSDKLLDGLARLLHVALVPRDYDQILGGKGKDLK